MNYKIIEPNNIEKACFRYLNDLKEENLTHNIKGLVLRKKFPELSQQAAEKIIRWWATNYSRGGNYETIIV